MLCSWGFLVAFLYSQTVPLFSLYLSRTYGASGRQIGLFYLALSISTIAVTYLTGKLSDKWGNRKAYILVGIFAGALAMSLYSLKTSFNAVLLISVGVFSILYISTPQIVAVAREYFDREWAPANVPFLNSVLRACFAFGWIAGVPIGFLIANRYGFTVLYIYLGIGYLSLFLLIAGFLQGHVSLERPEVTAPDKEAMKDANTGVWLAFLSFSLLYGVNHAYMINLPLFIEQRVSGSPAHAGYLMALAALIEIPVLLASGVLAKRMSIAKLLAAGSFCSLILYVGMLLTNTLIHLYVLQILNGLFIGLIAGLGLTWFQDQDKNQLGKLSSIYSITMTMGYILGSLVLLVASLFGQHLFLYSINAGFSALATIIIFGIGTSSGRHVRKLSEARAKA
ncbi:MAG: major facilitator superfamily 1 [Paucimonas sp.]|nr:major facilitator superfamily 1 [Paucimonas sp.]